MSSLSAFPDLNFLTPRRYDKLQIIVCADGEAGINFEHTGVDGRESSSGLQRLVEMRS
jgi:hypothetical protein